MPAVGHPVVLAEQIGKTYQPSPTWMRILARTVVREPVVALDDVSLTLNEGEICAVVGPNGAGKTTLFRVIAGLTTADTGRALVDGRDPMHDGRRVRAMIGWMPTEKRSLFLRQTTGQNLAFHGRIHGIPEKELPARIAETLDLVGLGGKLHAAPQSFSDGMRARLLLARALLHRPRLLLLDEPTGPIDPVAAYEVLELIVRLVREMQMGALISSHRLEEIAALQGRVLLMDRGRTVFDGDLSRMTDRDTVTVLTWRDAATAKAAHDRLDRGSLQLERLTLDTEARTVELVVPKDIALGRLLEDLAGAPDDLVSVTQRTRPLRELLASFYEGNRL